LRELSISQVKPEVHKEQTHLIGKFVFEVLVKALVIIDLLLPKPMINHQDLETKKASNLRRQK